MNAGHQDAAGNTYPGGFLTETSPVKQVLPAKKNAVKVGLIIAVIAAVILAGTFLILNSVRTPETESPPEIIPPDNPDEPDEVKSRPEGAEEFNGHYYKVVNESLYWSEAREKCEEEGGYLATITSQEEQNFVADLIEVKGEKKNYWLGGTDNEEEGVWRWITGEDWSYTNWRENQPDNRDNEDEDGDQNYLQICCGSYDEDRYMLWWDMSNSGISYGYEGYPNYKDTRFTGYVCEWDGQ